MKKTKISKKIQGSTRKFKAIISIIEKFSVPQKSSLFPPIEPSIWRHEEIKEYINKTI